MREVAEAAEYRGALYIPVGALWGRNDLQGAANRGILESLTITMRRHPAMVKLTDEAMRQKAQALADKNEDGEYVVYEGPVRGLCDLAPNNVNTMACAALACHSISPRSYFKYKNMPSNLVIQLTSHADKASAHNDDSAVLVHRQL